MPEQSFSFDVQGVAQLQRTMKKAGEDISDLDQAHQQASALVASVAVSTAPRRTGKLASTIRPARSKRRAEVQVKSVYAAPIHWGWPARHIEAQPWVSQAAQATEPQWIKIYEEAVQKAVDQVAGV